MSETDSFIEEVTDEVRRDRLFATMRRYGWIGILIVVAIVGGTAYREYSRASAAADAQAFGDAVLTALGEDSAAARSAALDTVTAPGPGARALVALLAAAEDAAGEEGASAAARLQQIASDGEVPQIYRQIASYKALSRADTALDTDTRRAGLEALAVPGQPLRLLAEEQLALIEIETGNRDAALELLRRIAEDSEATLGLQRRATQLIVALGGETEPG